jgi:NitT/TauT family transport system permease protein
MIARPLPKTRAHPRLRRPPLRAQVVLGWALVAAAFLGSWQYVASEHLMNPIFIGNPEQTGRDLYSLLQHGLWRDAAYTTMETAIGFALAAVAGMLVAFAVSQSNLARRVVSPFFIALNSLPRVALAPLFIIWFGIGSSSKIALAASLTFFVVFANTTAGVESVEPEHILLARVLGASRAQVFLKFVLPASIPGIFVGLELGFIFGMLGTVTGEMIAGQRGLGVRLSYFAGIFDTNSYFATLVLLTVITTALAQVFRVLRGRLLRWQTAHIAAPKR